MLIGIVILGGAALTFFAVQVQTKAQLERKANEVAEQLLKTTAIEEYVSLCLKEATEKGLMIMGNQGGVVYESQGGTTPDYGFPLPYGLFSIPSSVNNETYDVSYLLRQQTMSPRSTLYPTPPGYPYPGPVLPQQPSHIRDFHFGRITLKPLCDPNGPNRPGSVLYRSCETYGPPKSVQEELMDYININLKGCVDFGNLSQYLGYNLTEGEVSSNVTFTENSIVADASYPLTIILEGKPVSKVINFRTDIPIRLKTIHEFISNMLYMEANDLLFNITRDYQNFTRNGRQYWAPGIKLSLSKDPCNICPDTFGAPYDDIVTVIDENSLYQGQAFVMSFAIKNRIPVLDYIHTPNPIPELYDVVVLENASLNISPQGYDPDDDELEYHYYLWKVDYDEEFIGPGPEDISRIAYGGPNLWETSLQYLETEREAIIQTGRKDLGYHEVNVTVEDNEGLKDWQVVRILVNDLPQVDLKGRNIFDDIPNNKASIEDPYKLDGSGTVSIFSRGMTYSFSDDRERMGVFATGPNPIVFVPDENPNIRDIIPYIFSQIGIHTITLSVSDNMGLGATGVGADSIDVEVSKCLPHRNPRTAPYPFNNFTSRDDDYINIGNPYLADHTCCKDDYTVYSAQENKLCYTDQVYGCLSDFESRSFQAAPIDDYDADITYPSDPRAMGDENDVYRLTYSRYCDGERGNMCTGEQTATIRGYERCDECEYCVYGKESCQPHVINERFQCNNGIQRCSTGNYGLYSATGTGSGPQLCKGYCDNGACSTALDCVCSKASCNAQCDSSYTYEWDRGFTGNPKDDKCKYSCSASSCTFAREQACPMYAVTPDQYNPTKVYSATTPTFDHNPIITDYCNFGSNCGTAGCTYTYSVQMRGGYCDTCSPTGIVYAEPTQYGGLCPQKSATCSSNCPDSGKFYYQKPGTTQRCAGTRCDIISCDYKPGFVTTSGTCQCATNECSADCRTWGAANLPPYYTIEQARCGSGSCQCRFTDGSTPSCWDISSQAPGAVSLTCA